ncbi:MAG TPA: hypothetical protein VGJ26_07425 [Pirellulales bacterium]|jgi:hypothetical protein
MDKQGFQKWARLSSERLEVLIARGLPIQNGEIDPLVATKWLENNGLCMRTGFCGVVRTYREVATTFGVAINTVKKEWRGSGMPGKPGKWDLAEIANWKAMREKNPTHPLELSGLGDGDHSQLKLRQDLHLKKLAAETRAKEADASSKEREERVAQGGIVHRDNVDREVAEMIIAARSALKRIPREMMPLFPTERATEWAIELEKRIDRVLTSMSKWRPNYADP